MAASLFSLRPARKEDLPYLNGYAAAEGMDALPGAEGVTVAVNDEDVPVGFLRVVREEGWPAHVSPVVTCAPWRGFGVGRALVEEALARTGELRLVARGSSVPFYRALGFGELPWDAIAPPVAADCDGCDLRGECGPVPLGKVHDGTDGPGPAVG